MRRLKPLALAALLASATLGGCASPAQLATQDDAQCQAIGAEPRSGAYVQCRNLLVAQRIANQQEFFARLGAAGAALSDPPRDPKNPGARSAGFTQVCTYETLTGPVALTIGATEICPLTLPQ